jgi:hypothetical protein
VSFHRRQTEGMLLKESLLGTVNFTLHISTGTHLWSKKRINYWLEAIISMYGTSNTGLRLVVNREYGIPSIHPKSKVSVF